MEYIAPLFLYSSYNLFMLYRLARIFDFLMLVLVIVLATNSDTPQATNKTDAVRFYTRNIEFDYPN